MGVSINHHTIAQSSLHFFVLISQNEEKNHILADLFGYNILFNYLCIKKLNKKRHGINFNYWTAK